MNGCLFKNCVKLVLIAGVEFVDGGDVVVADVAVVSEARLLGTAVFGNIFVLIVFYEGLIRYCLNISDGGLVLFLSFLVESQYSKPQNKMILKVSVLAEVPFILDPSLGHVPNFSSFFIVRFVII